MSYEENRVTVSKYGTLSATSTLLVPVASVGKVQKLHVLAAAGFASLAHAVKCAFHFDLKAASGWRPHRWRCRKEYEKTLIAKYGSVEKGRLYLAFDSPHETGLAVDFGCGGLEPRSSTIAKQRETPLFHWLVDHAWAYGWHPYKVEPWHWEFPVSIEDFKSGKALIPISENCCSAESDETCEAADTEGFCHE